MSAILDGSADQQIEVLQDSKAADIALLMARLRTRKSRIAHCRKRIGPPPQFKKDRKAFSRGVMIATKLLGVEYGDARTLLAQKLGSAGYDEAFAKVATFCPEGVVGFVYAAQCPEEPGIVKIGFTTDLIRRRKELVREHGVSIVYLTATVGTYADEYVAQRAIGHRWLVGEWFGRAEDPTYCPGFIRGIRGAPVREIAENYLCRIGLPGPIANVGPFQTATEHETDFLARKAS